MNDAETVLHDVRDGVATVKINRPEMRNALSSAAANRLHDPWGEDDADKTARVAILTKMKDPFHGCRRRVAKPIGPGRLPWRWLSPDRPGGASGCALAAGKLMGLDQAGLAHAQGVVLSMASGSMEFLNDGAWTKRMHPGWAGVSGLSASAPAGAGFRRRALCRP